MKQGILKRLLAGAMGAVLLGTSIPITAVTAEDAETGAVIYSSDFEDSSASLPFTGRGGVESISLCQDKLVQQHQAESGIHRHCRRTALQQSVKQHFQRGLGGIFQYQVQLYQ